MRFSLFVAALDGRWLILKFKGYPHLNWYVSPWRDGCFLHIMALCFPKHEWHAETDVAMRDGSELAWRCATRWKRLVDSLLCRKGGAVWIVVKAAARSGPPKKSSIIRSSENRQFVGGLSGKVNKWNGEDQPWITESWRRLCIIIRGIVSKNIQNWGSAIRVVPSQLYENGAPPHQTIEYLRKCPILLLPWL